MLEEYHMIFPALYFDDIGNLVFVLEVDKNIVIDVGGFGANGWWEVESVLVDDGEVNVLELVVVANLYVVDADVDGAVGGGRGWGELGVVGWDKGWVLLHFAFHLSFYYYWAKPLNKWSNFVYSILLSG